MLIPLAKQSDFPHHGWAYTGYEDRNTPDNLCTYCGKRHVRYVHKLEHDEWPEDIEVGCVCAADLGLGEEARRGEREARNRASRLQRFIQNGWKTTKKGNPYKSYCDVRVAICGTGRYYKISINGTMGAKIFREQGEAMVHAFNYIEQKYR